MAEPRDPEAPLAGIGVLVTRPAHQAAPLARLIEQAGGTAILFPAIEIAPPRDPAALEAVLDRLDTFDLAVFVSPNAVEQTFRALRARDRSWPPQLAAACVGRATAAALERHGVSVAAVPERQFDSEALLAHPRLADVAGRRIVIFRGDGGRELLAETLRARGAEVTYAECYRRAPPPADPGPLIERWRRGEIAIVTITSSDALRNLYDALGDEGRALLLCTPIVVLSEAQAEACRRLGFATRPLVAAQPSDEAILERIKAWRARAFSL
ncbi:MAG TPA: uroporphyrinogen-III synthase [Burkholderiales bacterium]